jgi:ribA/ribD-fused uncharacterized protein
MKEDDKFVFFWQGGDIYSNFYQSNFYLYNKEFSSAEQCFMYSKAIHFQDFQIAKQILKTHEPMNCKNLGRKVKNYNEKEWNILREEKMFQACFAKFAQNEGLKEKLINTSNKILVEASPNDKIWGVGLREDDTEILNPYNWRGQNLLGKVLMKVREIIKEMH